MTSQDTLLSLVETGRLWDVIRRKYGLEYRLVLGIERLVARGQRPRVIVRVTTC